MTTEEETISGFGSETEQSMSKDLHNRRLLKTKEEKKMLKKRFNMNETDEFDEKDISLTDNFEQTEGIGYTESSISNNERKRR